MTAQKQELGRRLFYDPQLSANRQQSCASCHVQELGFAEHRAVSVGSTGDTLPRNSPGLVNVAYYSVLTWNNHLLPTLERQIVVPMFAEDPVELGLSGKEHELLARLRADPAYPPLFRAAFPGQRDPYSVKNVVAAIASFLRGMVAADSPYDRYRLGDSDALSAEARAGHDLFFSQRLRCGECHAGPNLSLAAPVGEAGDPRPFFNTGLYNVDGAGGYPAGNKGLYEVSGDAADVGKFRVPMLRNVALTAPYYHDGTASSLRQVIANYAAGGRNVDTGPHAGDGRASPLKDHRIGGFELSDLETRQLIAFLESLTDAGYVTDARFSDPFR